LQQSSLPEAPQGFNSAEAIVINVPIVPNIGNGKLAIV